MNTVKFVLIGITLGSITLSVANAQMQGVMLDDPAPMPEFELANQSGEIFNDDSLRDKWTLMMFGFLSCPDVCPFTLKNLEAAYSETALRVHPDSVPQFVFVSVDPDRDLSTVADYAAFFHPNFTGFSGQRSQIDRVVEATDSFYRLMPADSDGFYDVQHSASVSIINPDGMIIAKLQPPFDPGTTAEFIARLQIQHRRQ